MIREPLHGSFPAALLHKRLILDKVIPSGTLTLCCNSPCQAWKKYPLWACEKVRYPSHISPLNSLDMLLQPVLHIEI
jgi:hypothetical protein